MIRRPPRSTLFPSTPLFRSLKERHVPFALLTNGSAYPPAEQAAKLREVGLPVDDEQMITPSSIAADRSEEHTSELQSRPHVGWRPLPDKKSTPVRQSAGPVP